MFELWQPSYNHEVRRQAPTCRRRQSTRMEKSGSSVTEDSTETPHLTWPTRQQMLPVRNVHVLVAEASFSVTYSRVHPRWSDSVCGLWGRRGLANGRACKEFKE